MRQKVFVKLEKKLACDLKPGELFVMEPEEVESLGRAIDPSIVVYLRTNVPSESFSDMDVMVYKVHLTITDPEDPAPPRVNPHAPPGMNS